MTVDQLTARPDFLALTPQQQNWLREYCSNGRDKIAASTAAYQCKDDRTAVTIANRNLRVPPIKTLVREFYGDTDEMPTREQAIKRVWKLSQKNDTDAKTVLDIVKWIGEVSGWEKQGETTPPPSTEEVDDDEDAALLEEMKA